MNKKEFSNAIRFLSLDAVEKAKSGHPGAPMGMADIAYVLWKKFLKHNPSNPNWINRDRFVLSNGHGSMLLYSLLHLTGYKLSIDDIKNFRQLKSITPGHPECDITPGVETTTGPLGQGLANAVGMAIAEKSLASEFNKKGHNLIDHYTYVFSGDGCLMEGISHEVCSLAGTLGLNKLILIYDMNNISIDGDISIAFTENIEKRFESYGWNVINNIDGHDFGSIEQSISRAKRELSKPTIICMKTTIGCGSPNKQGTSGIHGAPLGESEVLLTRKNLGWEFKPFHIPKYIYKEWDAKKSGKTLEQNWNKQLNSYKKSYPKLYTELQRRLKNKLPSSFTKKIDSLIEKNDKSMATRKSSQVVLEHIGPSLPELIGGSADLKESNLVFWPESKPFSKKDASGKYIHYGVREFGMCAINNGIFLHGGFRPYGSTFLIFSEYAKNAIRMSALMHLPIINVFTHDSIGLGEDGPTHQAVEQLTSLRIIPGMSVWRPADVTETAISWKSSLEKLHGPSSLVLTRQTLPELKRTNAQITSIKKGGYILQDCSHKIDAILLSSGSETHLCLEAANKLTKDGLNIRVVSVPCLEEFLSQPKSYQNKLIPDDFDNILAVEAGIGVCWDKLIGKKGVKITMDTFGVSAPGDKALKHFGFTISNVIKQTKKLIKKNG
ncbi:MAG: transketolase [Gammaproteobacteria bacterium]|jgi:transketolase|nr:transketolase [Gammaproteobacteria bacterium]MBT4462239.1 transketolase [Gammaproteobacteria bacterium]MBT4654485.1 transketolase [Gammaproteobacteria bacterium]MBT5117362.1 transketolase [Gammaproteobacteria bacterium]MBT5761983.1 transketolase [Gammaproteobacteria bacterium]